MRFIRRTGIGQSPFLGEAGLPGSWAADAAGGWAVDRWRQNRNGVFTREDPYQLGRIAPIPPNTTAVQLRPNALEDFWEVGLIFKPKDRHQAVYGDDRVIARAGEIIPVPWEAAAGGEVEIYPPYTATPRPFTALDAAHAGWSATLCCLEKSDHRDAIRYRPPEFAVYTQKQDFDYVANDRTTDKVCPQLEYVPCKGMQSAILQCAQTDSESQSHQDITFASVHVMAPYRAMALPLVVVPPNQGASDGSGKTASFPIPPGAEALQVRAWRYNTAVSTNMAGDRYGHRLILSPSQFMAGPGGRSSGIAINVDAISQHVVCSVNSLPRHTRNNRVHIQVHNEDPADGVQITYWEACNSCNEQLQDQVEARAPGGPAVAANITTRQVMDNITWDACALLAQAAANVVNECRATMYAATV